MSTLAASSIRNDRHLDISLLGEIFQMEEILEVLQSESISVEEAVGLIGGLQQTTVQLFRASQP